MAAGPTLVDLPDDILLLVLGTLDSARDLRALALSCRRLHRFVDNDGWRVFVRNRFPSLEVPPPSHNVQGWKKTAESLTWQSRSWDKRSLQFQALLPTHPPPSAARVPRTRDRDRGGLFQPVIDAHFDPQTHEELVVWGAGENIVARYRQRNVADGKTANVTWLQSEGKQNGFRPGYDDVRALRIIKDQGKYHKSFLTGRDNGDLALLSTESGQFGKRLVEFCPQDPDGAPLPATAHDTITSIDLLNTNHKSLITATSKSHLFLYRLPADESTKVTPETVFDLKQEFFPTNNTQLCRATWMGEETMALALKGCKDPLRYMTLTPTGWTHHTAAKNPNVEELFGINYGNICPNSLQPIQSPSGRGNLLLSAWRDGTCRLQDLRTPSPFDTVYQDNVDPWADMESLMTYGTERFVGGGMNGAAIKIFDFRWPKSYYHTAGLPCLDQVPFSEPSQAFLRKPSSGGSGLSRCEPEKGLQCRWHNLSRDIYYRPNASFFLSNALPRRYSASGIWSLAKPSDLSPNFYIGISGGIIEANLEPSVGTMMTRYDPNFGFRDWTATFSGESSGKEAEVGYESRPLAAAMMETGDGFAFRQNDRAIRFPRMWMPRVSDRPAAAVSLEEEEDGDGIRDDEEDVKEGFFDPALMKHHRLDRRYQDREDYWGGQDRGLYEA
ncbi:EID1-like F-box protein 1 [Naviculisporaceae sp. PSN 640]